ncbi:MAG: hypothetical protein J0L76_02540 [Rhodobacterales bacterium]|nr:hypothetical protein [Rhodobacterales bacterium]
MRKFVILACLMGPTTQVAAEEFLQRPESCVLVATVQDDHCAVTNHFRCSGAGQVAFWQEISHGNGALEVHSLDADHGAIEIVMPGGAHIRSHSKGDHPRVAVKTGSSRSTERATLESNGSSQSATMVTEYTYKGETRELAGESFDRLTYASDLDFPESGSKLHTSGSVLFSDRLDLMILEVDVSDGQGGPARSIKLKSVALEGQKGFGSTKPRHGCN